VSSDFGVTWGSVVDLSDGTQNTGYLRVAMSADGRYQTVVWREYDGSHWLVQARSSSDFGATWSVATTVSAAGSSTFLPSLDMSSDGRYQTITWEKDDTTDQIMVSRSSNFGANWSTESALSASGENAETAQVAISADGQTQTVVWLRYDGSNFRIQARTSTDFGANWDPVIDLSEAGRNAYFPQIALSSDGSQQLATWTRLDDNSNRRVQVATSSDAGTTWGSVADLSAAGQSVFTSPQIALSSDGSQQFATWVRTDGSNDRVQIAASSDAGETWGSVTDLSAEGQSAKGAQVAVSANGAQQMVAWVLGETTNNSTVQVAVNASASSTPSRTAAMAEFRFFTPEGEECTSISPVRVQVGTMYTLPGEDALCRTMKDSAVAGWTIPVAPGFSGYGSESAPFPPGLAVRVIDSQRFTVVPFEPVLEFIYDSNVGIGATCADNAVSHSSTNGRESFVWVPRTDVSLARFASTPACTPSDHRLVGWNTNGDGTGETFVPGESLPVDWAEHRSNERHLYAMWAAG